MSDRGVELAALLAQLTSGEFAVLHALHVAWWRDAAVQVEDDPGSVPPQVWCAERRVLAQAYEQERFRRLCAEVDVEAMVERLFDDERGARDDDVE